MNEERPGADGPSGAPRVPLAAFMDVSLRLPRLSPRPALDGSLTGWPAAALLPDLTGLHGQQAFARVWAGWSVDGLALAFEVQSAVAAPWGGGGSVEAPAIWILCDTRDSRDARKPTRYCHHFAVGPDAGGRRGPTAVISELNPGGVRKADELIDVRPAAAHIRVQPGRGFALEVWLPREVLFGYAPLESGRIALAYRIRLAGGTVQDLAFGEQFPIWRNPGLWLSAVLDGAVPGAAG